MQGTLEQYRVRLESYVDGKDPIEMQRDALRTIAALIADVSEEELRRQPAAGKWSLIEILMHLAEDELVSTWRYRQMLEHDLPQLTSFDPDVWARLGAYASCDLHAALAIFRLLREANLRMFARLTPQDWQRCGIHEERGKISVYTLCKHMAAHDVNHIQQMRRILERNKS